MEVSFNPLSPHGEEGQGEKVNFNVHFNHAREILQFKQK
jgi:L-lysine 2,3-aminomutase